MEQPPPPSPKPAWPLFLLGGLSFVPGLGFLLGSVAAGWGLVSSRPRALVAAAIGAVGAVLNLIGFLVLGSQVFNSPELQQAKLELARQGLAEVVEAVELYRKEQGSYPPSLIVLSQKFGLQRPVRIFDPSAGLLGLRPFQYRLAPNGESYDLFAVGADGTPGTDDDLRPVVPDSMKGKVGLRW
ncbi:MAG TPA: hypothetical protein VJK71_09700 [Gemmatimonadales bacterium]|nr:hypothetical protein [Gemmatimonadales bacterium]